MMKEADVAVMMKDFMKLITTHGAIYLLLDEDFIAMKLKRIAKIKPALVQFFTAHQDLYSAMAGLMFKHLADQLPGGNRKYIINSPLISHLTIPHEGRTFSILGEPNDNIQIPTFMTFTGQFVDHDLTLNPINLFNLDNNPDALNQASAIVDLDSMYHRNSILAHRFPNDDGMDVYNGPSFIFDDATGAFQLNRLGPNAYDFMRDPSPGEHHNQAYIFDLRNDENQIISQIHMLLMRLHNKLV